MANRHPKRRMARSVRSGVSEAHDRGRAAVDDVRRDSVRSLDVAADDLHDRLSRAAATRAESGGGGFGARRARVADVRADRRQGRAQAGHQPVVRVVRGVAGAGGRVRHAQSVYVVATFCALALGFMACGFITAYVYTPELYPTSIRAIGCGLGGAWLKVAAIFAPALVGKTMIGGNLEVAFYMLAAVPFLAAVAVHFLGSRRRGRCWSSLKLDKKTGRIDDAPRVSRSVQKITYTLRIVSSTSHSPSVFASKNSVSPPLK